MFSKFKSPFPPSKKPMSEDHNEGRRRNRLSKPPTNSSSLNLSSLSLLQPGIRNSTLFPLNASTEELQDQSQVISNEESRDLSTATPTATDSVDSQAKPQLDTKDWKGDALTLTEVKKRHSISPSPRSSIVSPLSAIFNTSRLSLLSSSKENKDTSVRTPPNTDDRSRNPSREDITTPIPIPIPIRRKSLRQPGIATRISKDGPWGVSPQGEAGANADSVCYNKAVFPEEASCTGLEALNLETPRGFKPVPPPLVRTETPDDLVFLGGLRLGSLHVTNGRASPAPSDLSRRAKAKSTPNLRAASSEYDESDPDEYDADARAFNQDGSLSRQNMPELPARFISQPPRYQSPLRLTTHSSLPRLDTTRGDIAQSLPMRKRLEDTRSLNTPPDRSNSMAEDYMAELPTSPFAVASRSSTLQSMLQTTTKSTEFDDNLFEAESITPSDADSVDTSTVDTFYSSSDVMAAQDKQVSSNKSRPAYTLNDSGYSSNSSFRDGQEENHGKTVAEETDPVESPLLAANTPQNELTIPKNSEDRRPGPHPIRPSILKSPQVTTASLPIFKNLYQSTTTICTVMTTTSAPPTHKGKKLIKHRSLSRSSHWKEITVQGNREVFTSSIPPIPAEFAANLAIRSQQVPELEHTFETRENTAESPTSSRIQHVEIRFPSPNPSVNGTDDESARPQARIPRQSTFRRRSRSEKKSTTRQSGHDMSETDALAVIQDFGTVGHALGGNPYDIARPNLQSSSQRNIEPARNVNPHNITSASKRPKSHGGMDAETAAELARMRSRSIYERDSLSLAEKRDLFNDRGGLPGKNLRPMSFAASAPPLPSLPNSFDPDQRRSWAPQTSHAEVQQVNSWRPQYDQPYDNSTRAQPANNQSGNEHWAGPTQYQQGNRSFSEGYQSEFCPPEVDRRQSWRSDRVEIDFDPQESWAQGCEESDFGYQYQDNRYYEGNGAQRQWQSAVYPPYRWNQSGADEDAPPPPPPPHSPRPLSIAPVEEEQDTWASHGHAWQARRQSAGEALRHSSNPGPLEDGDSLYPEIPPRDAPSGQAYHEAYGQPSNTYHRQTLSDNSAPQASYGSRHIQSNNRHPSRPHSQAHSYHGSHAGSLAESLHPLHDPPRVSPSPQFGRYSGGFSYGYERGSGFGGSAGTRSVSGVAGASRKGKELSEGYGVDLSDVPIIAGLKKL